MSFSNNTPQGSPGGRKPFNIAIVGGGIGGLSLCIGLLKNNIPVHLYEAASAFAEIGAGVSFGSNAQRAMAKIDPGIREGYDKISTRNQWVEKERWWFEFRMGQDGRSEKNPFKAGERFFSRVGAQNSVHRAHFLDTLISFIPEGTASFGKKVENIEETHEGVLLKFADGTTAEATAVIGCDGVKSRTRTILLGEVDPEHCKPSFTGKYAYRGLIPMDAAAEAVGDELARNSQMYMGYGAHILTFPIEKGKTMNVVAFRTEPEGKWEHEDWVLPMKKEHMYRDYEGWGPEAQKILRLMQKPDLWALFNHPPAKTYYRKGKICLLGDCAHASTPHQGAGAGMALEDAFILSGLLGEVKNRDEIEKAFRAYDEVRRPRTQKLVKTSREAGELYELQLDGVMDDIEKVIEDLEQRYDWIWEVDLDAELDKAKAIFRG